MAKKEPLRNSLGLVSLQFLDLLLGLGVLAYLFYPMVSTISTAITKTTMTTANTTTTSTSTTMLDHEDTDQSDKTAKTTTTTTATPQLVTEKSSGSTGAGTLSRPMTWQFYPLVVSSSLLLAYLTYLALRFSYSRSARAQRWVKRLAGKPPKEEKMLFLPRHRPSQLGELSRSEFDPELFSHSECF